ncbi:MAG: response regulator transcription factor [Flavobacteriales bacterium]|nr:response regulator transcription factor [Flavobacteriales bacterium]
MKVLVVDDEFNSRRIVRKLLGDQFPELTFLNDASDIEEAIVIIKEDQPDLVLLDIQINTSTGFDLLDKIEDRNFELVFITAYDHYALKAFDVGAVNYVLKPIDRKKLFSTIEKIIEQISSKKKSNENDGSYEPLDKLILPYGETSKVIAVADIVYVKAAGAYSEVFLGNSKGKMVVVKPLNFFEGKLESHPHFFRVHKSYLVNLSLVTSISGDRSSLTLQDDTLIPVARLRKDELKEKLKSIFY